MERRNEEDRIGMNKNECNSPEAELVSSTIEVENKKNLGVVEYVKYKYTIRTTREAWRSHVRGTIFLCNKVCRILSPGGISFQLQGSLYFGARTLLDSAPQKVDRIKVVIGC